MTLSHVALSLALFILAGLFEIGGGYLVWRWWRDGGPWAWGAAGAIILALYGIVPTYQPAHFGRVYAAYGGVFVVMSVAWGWAIGGARPDRFDLAGSDMRRRRGGDHVRAAVTEGRRPPGLLPFG